MSTQISGQITQVYTKIKGNIGKVIVGKSETLDMLLVSLLCGGHVLLEDVPGTGKTVLIKSLAASVSCQYKRIQFTLDLLPSTSPASISSTSRSPSLNSFPDLFSPISCWQTK